MQLKVVGLSHSINQLYGITLCQQHYNFSSTDLKPFVNKSITLTVSVYHFYNLWVVPIELPFCSDFITSADGPYTP